MLPRLAAVAEAGWTPQEKRDYVSFEERIRKDAVLYDLKGWNYGKLKKEQEAANLKIEFINKKKERKAQETATEQ